MGMVLIRDVVRSLFCGYILYFNYITKGIYAATILNELIYSQNGSLKLQFYSKNNPNPVPFGYVWNSLCCDDLCKWPSWPDSPLRGQD